MYRGIEWVTLHMTTQELLHTPMPDVGMIVPAIIDGEYIETDIEEFFNRITAQLSRWIHIAFIPVEDFSMKMKTKKSSH